MLSLIYFENFIYSIISTDNQIISHPNIEIVSREKNTIYFKFIHIDKNELYDSIFFINDKKIKLISPELFFELKDITEETVSIQIDGLDLDNKEDYKFTESLNKYTHITHPIKRYKNIFTFKRIRGGVIKHNNTKTTLYKDVKKIQPEIKNLFKINDISYLNGVITIGLSILLCNSSTLIIETDSIVKKIKVDKPSICIQIPKNISNYEDFSFKINGISFREFVIDKSKFPTSIIRTKNGFKFDKIPITDIKVNNNLIKTNSKTFILSEDLNQRQVFNVYVKDIVLFSQNFIPKKENSLRVYYQNKKLIFTFSERVKTETHVYIKEANKKITIPIFESENYLYLEKPLKKGIHSFHLNINDSITPKKYYVFIH
jgi:hypothetical protein